MRSSSSSSLAPCQHRSMIHSTTRCHASSTSLCVEAAEAKESAVAAPVATTGDRCATDMVVDAFIVFEGPTLSARPHSTPHCDFRCDLTLPRWHNPLGYGSANRQKCRGDPRQEIDGTRLSKLILQRLAGNREWLKLERRSALDPGLRFFSCQPVPTWSLIVQRRYRGPIKHHLGCLVSPRNRLSCALPVTLRSTSLSLGHRARYPSESTRRPVPS